MMYLVTLLLIPHSFLFVFVNMKYEKISRENLTLTLCEFTYHDVISVLIPVFNSQSVIIGFGSDDSDGHDDNDDDDGNYENLSGLEWFALQRTLMLNSTGFHTGFKLFL